jgi:tetratricopeptide (TPR) repeat protein
MKKEQKSYAEPALWGFAQRTFPSGSRPQIHFCWGRISLVILGLLVVGWLTVAGALYFYFKKNLYFEEASYLKMVSLPFRIDAHRKELGNFHIEKAKGLIQQKKYREALEFLRAGVARSPGNLEGRRMLADFFDFGLKQHDDAADILMRGVFNGGVGDPEYMSAVFRYLLLHEYDDRIVELGEDLLKEDIEQDKVSRLTALATATACFNLYKYERALLHIEQYNLLEVPEGNILAAQVYWGRGERQKAMDLLAVAAGRFPAAAQIYTRISDFNSEAGDLHAARRNAVLAQVTNPMSLDIALKVLALEYRLGMEERAEGSFHDVLNNFPDDRPSLLKVANTVSGLGRADLMAQVGARALEAGFVDSRFSLAQMSAYIIGAQFHDAHKFGTELLQSTDEWKVKYHRSLLLCLLCVAAFGQGDTERGRILLQDFFQAPLPPADEIHHLASHFKKSGMLAQERQVLLFCREKHPGFRPVLEDLVRRDLLARNYLTLPKHVRDMLLVRRKNAPLLRQCMEALNSDIFLFLPERLELVESLGNTLRKVEFEEGLPPT